jgi:hypothetical protein
MPFLSTVIVLVAPGDADSYATFTLGALKEILLETATKKRARRREEIVGELFRFLEGGYLRVPRQEAAAEEKPEVSSKPRASRSSR